MQFEEWEACVAVSLDLEKWYKNRYSQKFKAKVVAFNRLRKLVDAHVENARIQASKKKSKSHR